MLLSPGSLRYTNLSGVNLAGYDVAALLGLSAAQAKAEEIRFAKELIEKLKDGENELEMGRWHTCETSHCLAGWAYPNESAPQILASRKLLTLTKYFYSTNAEAYAALERVACGKESVF